MHHRARAAESGAGPVWGTESTGDKAGIRLLQGVWGCHQLHIHMGISSAES